MKLKKYSSLAPPRIKFNKTQLAWQGEKFSRLISIFTSKNVWKFLIKIQLTKSNSKIYKGVNPPCLMPIRVKHHKKSTSETISPQYQLLRYRALQSSANCACGTAQAIGIFPTQIHRKFADNNFRFVGWRQPTQCCTVLKNVCHCVLE